MTGPEPAPAARIRAGWLALALATILSAASLIAVYGTGPPAEQDSLVVLSGHDDSLGGARRELIKTWNATHDNDSQATLVELSSIADAQRAEMLAVAQSGGAVDVYNLDVTWTAEFADAGYIEDLDRFGIPTQDFLPAPLQTCRYRGRLWALPFNTDVGLLYYNKQLLGAADPPPDWATLERQAQQVVAARGGEVAGYLGQYGDYEGLTVTALELAWGAGGDLVGPNGAVLPDPDAVLAGLDRLAAIAPRDVPDYNEATSLDAFSRGGAVFMRNWPVAYRNLQRELQRERQRAGAAPIIDFGVAPLPGYSGALGGQNLALSATTDRPELARELITFLTSVENQRKLAGGWLPPTRRSAYPALPVESPADRAVAATLVDALEHARPRPVLPHYAQVSETFRAAVDGYLRTGTRPDPTMLRDRLDAARLGRLVTSGRN